jgi:hypothetical protein
MPLRYFEFHTKLYLRPKGSTPLGKFRHWKENIDMDLTEIGFEHVDWVYRAQDRICWQSFVHMVLNLQIHKSKEFLLLINWALGSEWGICSKVFLVRVLYFVHVPYSYKLNFSHLFFSHLLKVKQSRYRHGQTQRVPGS